MGPLVDPRKGNLDLYLGFQSGSPNHPPLSEPEPILWLPLQYIITFQNICVLICISTYFVGQFQARLAAIYPLLFSKWASTHQQSHGISSFHVEKTRCRALLSSQKVLLDSANILSLDRSFHPSPSAMFFHARRMLILECIWS